MLCRGADVVSQVYYPRVCASLGRLSLANGHCARTRNAPGLIYVLAVTSRCITGLISVNSPLRRVTAPLPSLPCPCATRHPSEIYFRLLVR